MEEVLRIVGIGLVCCAWMLLILIFLDKNRWLLWFVVFAMINLFFSGLSGSMGFAPDFEVQIIQFGKDA